MPRQNIDFSKAVIYKIVNRNPDITDQYIGSSSNFIRRRCRHKYNSKTPTASEYNYRLYKHIRQMGGWDFYKMEVIEQYVCESRAELIEREKHYIHHMQCNLNTKK